MKTQIYILILLIFSSLFLVTIPNTVSAEHATCSQENDQLCGALMDWQTIFNETTIRGPSIQNTYNGDTPFESNNFETTLSDSYLAHYRNLYHGISIVRNESVAQSAFGEEEYSSRHWLPGDSNFRPIALSSDFSLKWDNIFSSSSEVKPVGEDANHGGAKLTDSTTSFSSNTWSGGLFTSNVKEEGWDSSEWNLGANGGKFKPTLVKLGASIPENTTVRVEIYEPVDNGQISGNSNNYLLGYAEFKGNDTPDSGYPANITEPIMNDQAGSGDFGLHSYSSPESTGGASATFGNIRPYHINVEISRQSTNNKSPVLAENNPIQIGETRPTYRSSNKPWFGYPLSLPSLTQVDDASNEDNFARDDRFKVSSQRSGGFTDDFFLGHTETMVKNFDDKVQDDVKSTSVAPMIPRDPVNNKQKIEEFYHAGASNATGNDELYHVISDKNQDNNNNDIENQIFFHHVYSEIPRVEMSTHYQDQYEDMTSNEWNTVASSDGVVYAITDGAVNEIDYMNSNIKTYKHEETNQINRKYGYNFPSGTNLDLPSYSKSSYSSSDLKTNAIRMSYEIENFTIKPKIGGEYWDTNNPGNNPGFGGYPGSTNEEVVLNDPKFIEPRDFVLDYNKSLIDSNRPGSSYEMRRFYSNIIDVRVNYTISYERLKYTESSCPTPNTSIDKEYDNGTLDDVDPVPSGGHSYDPSYSSWDSNIYKFYSNYYSNQYSGDNMRDDTDAEGRESCTNPNNEKLDGIEWVDTDWSFAQNHVNHDDGTMVVFNGSDDGVAGIIGGQQNNNNNNNNCVLFGFFCGNNQGGNNYVPIMSNNKGPQDITSSKYPVTKFDYELWEDERKTDEAFEVKNAIGSKEDESLTYFNRDTSVGVAPSDTRWTRAEATAIQERNSLLMNSTDGSSEDTIPVEEVESIMGDYNEPADATNIKPLDGTIPDHADVYLDIVNYGPDSGGELSLSVQGTTVDSDLTSPSTSGYGYEKYKYVTSATPDSPQYSSTDHTYNITDIVRGESDINIGMEYDGSANSGNYDMKQRFDYVITFETHRPIQSIESRWAHSTFRDTRYDVLYEFESSDCVVNPNKNCYEYNKHGIPFKSLDGDEGTYNTNYNQPNPENNNPLTTHYPSKSMISHPYLIPTSYGIENRDVDGSTITEPIYPTTEYLEDELNVENNDVQGQTDINLEADGNFIIEPVGRTNVSPVEPNAPTGQPQMFVSEDIHQRYSEKSQDPSESGLDLEHWSNRNFPAMMQYPVLDNNGDLTNTYDNSYSWDQSAFPNNVNSNDIDVHNMWFEDGRMMMNATVDDRNLTGNMTFSDMNVVVLDFPESIVQNWRDWNNLDPSGGVLFGGYEPSNYDQIRRHEIGGSGIFSISSQLSQSVSSTTKISGTYEEQSNSWLVKANDVESSLTSSDPLILDYVDWSPMNSNRCANDTSREMRYCSVNIGNLAGYNYEEAYRQDMTDHIDAYSPPINREIEKMPYIEHTEFQVKDDDKSYASWSVAADASWSTRDIQDDKTDQPMLFDSTTASVKTINNVTESIGQAQISNYQNQLGAKGHEFVNNNQVSDDSIQQYSVTVRDEYENPVSFSNRTTGNSIDVASSTTDDFRKEEGVCITAEDGDLSPNTATSDTTKCYSTNNNGTIYYTLESDNPNKKATEIEQNIKVVGSQAQWWEYSNNQRLIAGTESNYTSINTLQQAEEIDGGISTGQPVMALIILLILVSYVLSMVMRIRLQPSQGPDTKDVLGTIVGPFMSEPIKRLSKMFLYMFMYIFGFSLFISAIGADINPFFLFEAVVSALFDAILSYL